MRASVAVLCAVAVAVLMLTAAVSADLPHGNVAKAKAGAGSSIGGAKGKAKVKAKHPPHLRTRRVSPLKGQSPSPKPKGRQPTDRVPKTFSAFGNAAMGAAGKADAPKPRGGAATAGPIGGARAKVLSKAKTTVPAKAKAKVPAGKLHKFRQQHVLQADADAQTQPTYPMRTPKNDGWLLSASAIIPDAMIDKIKAEMPPMPQSQTFYHWDQPQPCMRWARAGMSQGEMQWFDGNSAGMVSGGGLYMSSSLNSANYGPYPCRIVIKAGTLQYDDYAVSRAFQKAKLPVPAIGQNEKVALGQIIPFLHYYSTSSGWYVTHHWDVFERFLGGVFAFDAKTLVVPHFDSAPDWQANTHMTLWKMWRLIDSGAQGAKSGQFEPESVRNDLKASLDWLKRFTYLFSYIDGPSLLRALSVSPNDPFNVFEKERFPSFVATYDRMVQARLAAPATPVKSLFGVSKGGRFGSDTAANADAWAKEIVTTVYPNLWKEVSGTNNFALRMDEVRAGGDQDGRTFIATSGQVQVLKQNQFLVVVDSPPQPDGTILTYYYYPDPLHRNPAIKTMVSQATWDACEDVLRAATAPGANVDAVKTSDAYKTATQQLLSELLTFIFKRVYNGDASYTGYGLQIMMDLVSVHPNDDFNGRTTRLFGVMGCLESGLDPPIAFMSDFDLVTDRSRYGQFLTSAGSAYLKLKLAMTSELMTAVNNNVMPNHYAVGAWATFAKEALGPFLPSSTQPFTFGDSDWDDIAHRRFVKLMDKYAGDAWYGRNGNAGTPAVQKAGDPLPLVAPPPKK